MARTRRKRFIKKRWSLPWTWRLTWTWRKALTLVWAAVMVLTVWTWAYAWDPFKHVVLRHWVAFVGWFPPFWLTVSWRIGITLTWFTLSIILAWAWWRPRPRPAWLTRAGWAVENRPAWFTRERWVGPGFLRSAWSWLRSWWHPPDLNYLVEIGKDKDLKNAYEWAGDYAPTRNGEIYEAILDFAEKSYEEMVNVSDGLDKKADDLMKISGTIGAALAAAGRISGASALLSSRPVLFSVGSLVFTMLICARTRKPVKKIVPMTIKAAIEVAECGVLPYVATEIGDAGTVEATATTPSEDPGVVIIPLPVHPSALQVKATIAASYHWATVGTQYVIEWKAKQIGRATFAFCLGLVLLVYTFLQPFG
jgi:hypothetical protein